MSTPQSFICHQPRIRTHHEHKGISPNTQFHRKLQLAPFLVQTLPTEPQRCLDCPLWLLDMGTTEHRLTWNSRPTTDVDVRAAGGEPPSSPRPGSPCIPCRCCGDRTDSRQSQQDRGLRWPGHNTGRLLRSLVSLYPGHVELERGRPAPLTNFSAPEVTVNSGPFPVDHGPAHCHKVHFLFVDGTPPNCSRDVKHDPDGYVAGLVALRATGRAVCMNCCARPDISTDEPTH